MGTGEFDLEERTAKFAEKSRNYFNKLPKTISNLKYTDQGIRSCGSVAANYIEANEALSKKDFYMRIKICKKEAKESRLWFRLSEPSPQQDLEKQSLTQEATELTKIFSTILKSNN
ncbi:MAG TPA: four helix bundle protein [Patescibacteria group bacterium]|nr:four helix bundle protein [Patescibacteria group bacterium]